MQNRKPAPFNVVSDDPTGTTWALPEGAIARFGKGDVHDVKLSPDGTYFAVATGMGVWWYDVSSMLPISLWETERGLISSVDFSYDGRWIVIANWDETIKVLDVQSGECIHQIEGQSAFAHIAFSSNGKWIATADMNGVVKVLDVQRGVCLAQMDRGTHEFQPNDISQLEFSPDGELLAATAQNPEVYLDEDQPLNPDTEGYQTYVWHPETGEAIVKFAGRDFVFSSDSCLLAGAAADETLNDANRVDRCVSVWDVTTGERIAHFTGHSDWVNAVAFSPCGQFLASSDGTLRVWELATGVQQMAYPDFDDPFYSKDGVLYAVVFPRDTDTIETWNVEHREKILEISDGIGGTGFAKSLAIAYTQKQTQQSTQKRSSEQIDNIPVYAILREPRFPWPDPKVIWVDDQTLASKSIGRGIMIWDVLQKRVRETLMKDEFIRSFTVLSSGRILASYIYEDSKVWDISKPDIPIAEFNASTGLPIWERDAVFSPTGDRVAVGSKGGILYVWNLQQPENPIKLSGHTDYTWAMAFSPDGKRLASGAADETARLWDIASGEQIATLPLDEPCTPMGIAFSPCGELIAGGMDDEIRLWCAEQWTTLRSLPQSENTRRTYDALAFSPCGKYLASGTWWQQGMEKMAIRLWDVATAENIHTFWGHTTDVQSLAFSPDGKMLASGGFDGTILLWDVKPFINT